MYALFASKPFNDPGRVRVLAFLVLVLTAVLFRTVALGAIPAGVDADEALNGNEGLDAAQTGEYRLYYPNNNGREGLFINLVGFSERVFGPGPPGMRIPAAIIGSLTVVFVCLLGKEMLGWEAAIFGGWLMATNFWHILLSRMALRAILMPLLLTASLYLVLKALRGRYSSPARFSLATAGGLLYGLGFHSYIAYRITPLIVIAFFGVELRRRMLRELRPWATLTGAWCAGAILAAVPIAIYFVRHPADFFYRTHQVSVLRSPRPFNQLWHGAVGALTQFGPFAPSGDLLLWPVALLAYLGAALAVAAIVRRQRNAAAGALLLCWLGLMLVPTILTGAASGLRSLGTVTPIFLLAGWGTASIFARLPRPWARCLMLAALLAVAPVEAYRYVRWAHSPDTLDKLNIQCIQTAQMLNALPPSTQSYMALDSDDDDLRIDYRNPTGRRIALPITAEIVILQTRQHRVPIFFFKDEAATTPMPAGSVLVQMYPSPDFFPRLQALGIRLRTGIQGSIPYAVIQ